MGSDQTLEVTLKHKPGIKVHILSAAVSTRSRNAEARQWGPKARQKGTWEQATLPAGALRGHHPGHLDWPEGVKKECAKDSRFLARAQLP